MKENILEKSQEVEQDSILARIDELQWQNVREGLALAPKQEKALREEQIRTVDAGLGKLADSIESGYAEIDGTLRVIDEKRRERMALLAKPVDSPDNAAEVAAFNKLVEEQNALITKILSIRQTKLRFSFSPVSQQVMDAVTSQRGPGFIAFGAVCFKNNLRIVEDYVRKGKNNFYTAIGVERMEKGRRYPKFVRKSEHQLQGKKINLEVRSRNVEPMLGWHHQQHPMNYTHIPVSLSTTPPDKVKIT